MSASGWEFVASESLLKFNRPGGDAMEACSVLLRNGEQTFELLKLVDWTAAGVERGSLKLPRFAWSDVFQRLVRAGILDAPRDLWGGMKVGGQGEGTRPPEQAATQGPAGDQVDDLPF